MTITTSAAASAAIIEQFNRDAAILQGDLDAMTDEQKQQYLILVADLAMKVWTAADGTPHCEWMPLAKATRYDDRFLARRVADTIVNGHGDHGIAVSVEVAYLQAIAEYKRLAALIARQ